MCENGNTLEAGSLAPIDRRIRRNRTRRAS